MRILQVNVVCGVGSTGRIATDIHNLLVHDGHESVIAYGREPIMGCESVVKIGNKLDFYVHALGTRLFDAHGRFSKGATLEFVRTVKEISPDVVHLHNIHGYHLHFEVLFSFLKSSALPVIWTFHDCWPFTGHCAHFDYVGCDRWRTSCHSCPSLRDYPKSLYVDRSRKNYFQKSAAFKGVTDLTIVTPSKWLANLVSDSFLSEYPVRVINNGIDLDVFFPTQGRFREVHGIEDKFLILGVASEFNSRKGFDYLMSLANRLAEDEVMVLVGVTAEQIRSLPNNVIGVSRTNNPQELASIYTAADVFVNTTLEDTFPTVNLEALACGTPVVTFGSGGSGETVDSTCGFVVARGDLSGILSSIGIVKSRGKVVFSEDCRAFALRRFDKRDRFREYIDLYKAVISR